MVTRTSETGGQDSLAPAWLWTHLRLGEGPALQRRHPQAVGNAKLGRWIVARKVTAKVTRVSGTEWTGTQDGCTGRSAWRRGGGAVGGPGQCRVTRARGPRKEGCSFKLTSFRDVEEHEDWGKTTELGNYEVTGDLADGTLSIKQCTRRPLSPPSPLGSASSREVLPADESPHQLLSSPRPQTPWFSACTI